MKLSIIPIHIAGIAQLVEHNLAKVGVASSSLVSRSKILFIKINKLQGNNKPCGLFFIVDWSALIIQNNQNSH